MFLLSRLNWLNRLYGWKKKKPIGSCTGIQPMVIHSLVQLYSIIMLENCYCAFYLRSLSSSPHDYCTIEPRLRARHEQERRGSRKET